MKAKEPEIPLQCSFETAVSAGNPFALVTLFEVYSAGDIYSPKSS